MLVLAVAGLTVLMISTRRKILRQSLLPKKTIRNEYESLQKRSHAGRDMEDVMVELDRLSRQIHGRIDTKFAKLEVVIRHADRRISKLQRLLEQARAENRSDPQQAQPRQTTQLAQPAQTSPPMQPTQPAQQQQPTHQRTTAAGTTSDTGSRKHRTAIIRRLAAEGMTAQRIAAQTGIPIGEVELVLSLQKASQPR